MKQNNSCFFSAGENLASNPCSVIGCPSDLPNPDPFVIRFLGSYYCYSTADAGVNVLISQDLIHWEYRGYALEVLGEHGFWAPSVIYRNGKFYMYYSSCRGKEFEWMRVASAEHPLGPFHFEKDLSACFSIDTHAVRGIDGDYYLFYSTDNACGNCLTRPGTSVLVDRFVDPVTLEGKPRLILTPTIDQEISGKGAVSSHINWHTIEGAFYLRHGGEEYLMYSGNSFEREDYFVGYACPVEGTCLGNKRWKKYPSQEAYRPFLHKTDKVSGTGHNSVTKAPNLVDDWCVYHARLEHLESVTGREQRLLFTDRILWDRENMWIAGPTCEERDIPACPGTADDFRNGLGKWEEVSGLWSEEDGKVVQSDVSVPARLRYKTSCRDFFAEIWVKTDFQPHGSLMGVSLFSIGESVEFLLHEGLSQAQIIRVRNNVRILERAIPLEAGYAHFAWHCIRLEKCGYHIRFLLDDFELAEISCCNEKVFLELYTQLCRGEFAAFAMTGCLRAEGTQIAEHVFCETKQGVFEGNEDGITYFTSSAEEGKMTIECPDIADYEAALDIYSLETLSNTCWILELSEQTRVNLLLEQGQFVTREGNVPLVPKGHTVRIRVRNRWACVLLDGNCVYEGGIEGSACLVLRVASCIRLARLDIIGRGMLM